VESFVVVNKQSIGGLDLKMVLGVLIFVVVLELHLQIGEPL
jgi:hypothetical protein